MSPEEHSEFWRKVQFTVDKDVVRTDRSNDFFRGENNPNVEIMRSDHRAIPCPYQSSGQTHRFISYSESRGSHQSLSCFIDSD